MPNSRLIPPTRKRSNSASPAYSTTKKGFMSRLLPQKEVEKKSGGIEQQQRPRTLSQPISQNFLSNLPDQYLTRPPLTQPIEVSRKSDGSISVYSTFGYSQENRLAQRAQAERALEGSKEGLFASEVWTTHTEFSCSLPEVNETESLPSEPLESRQESHIVEQPQESHITARQLWNEDESVVSKEKMAEWLGLGKPFHSLVLYQYMQLFQFADMRLDVGFRRLCSKLYFKAEAQQIDRILEQFAHRYWD
ncbi:hypothetical protein CU098_004454, partial [Rhizopus stolonifer]